MRDAVHTRPGVSTTSPLPARGEPTRSWPWRRLRDPSLTSTSDADDVRLTAWLVVRTSAPSLLRTAAGTKPGAPHRPNWAAERRLRFLIGQNPEGKPAARGRSGDFAAATRAPVHERGRRRALNPGPG
jgi:hypothetical protein